MTQYKYGDDHTKPTHHKDRKEVNIFDILFNTFFEFILYIPRLIFRIFFN
ncbi:hypothetical protein LNK15_10935 [Jeotgalicoccus huakuii]|nr:MULTISPECIES: hypothetical protein [Jeotgalicoccus]MCK1977572.1 hypothetical protein [Jeotgalicoccus huakuii]QQD84108.1 hypothetical protein JEM45_05420 [Jeotgalicoccus sp. ATCC 8456]